MLRKDGFCIGVTSYLAFSVPRPPVLRILALALAFFLSSVSKFAQQRLRGSCRERERGQNHVRRTTSCDPLRKKEAFLNCVAFLFFYHRISVCPSSLPPLGPPMELLDKFPDRQCWQALPTPAQAGSP